MRFAITPDGNLCVAVVYGDGATVGALFGAEWGERLRQAVGAVLDRGLLAELKFATDELRFAEWREADKPS